MLEKLLSAISDWPVIVQGALGSALFASMVYVGQKIATTLNMRAAEVSKKRRKDYLYRLQLKYGFKAAKDNAIKTALLSALLYLAARDALRGAVWLALGLLTGSFLPVLGAVGFLGALYYWFTALSAVSPAPEVDNVEERFKQVNEEWEALNKDAKAPSAADTAA